MRIWEGVVEFTLVAELGSFTKASQNLNISVAQVSRLISLLEKRLKTKLLYRTTRKVTLTAEGEIYYQRCKQVLNELEEAERALGNLQNKPQGTIKLTAPVMYGETFIQPLVHEFMRIHPAIEVTANLSNQQLDLIDGGYDLAIRLGKLKDSTLIAKPLSQRRYRVCASPSYLKDYGAPHSLPELVDHNCLVGQHQYWRFEHKGKQVATKVIGTLSCNSGYALVDAALKNLGLIQLPNYYVDDHIEKGHLVEVLSKYREEPETIWAVYPHNRHLSPKVRQLVNFLAQGLDKN
ncbi:LysR family transcriptional regulator [Bermanella marisrubri]|uniref:Transcriptional regulator, LysR family protein n=1 Tax=Bermanella marisrubri TaxID=207949 RepID=Q1MXT1_9GAMM|nr:LysR substrate-binding domain-containing protein [Bermanella marisrubri]EAT10770.1 transcriptional regulator, LysR family protein [Oceanobacter sp. RED65] [Bermanella marisrubri]QIZ83477.1 LysR family transcriptional regulator [Bermanella marisrubri]